jgi:hypothetical protein
MWYLCPCLKSSVLSLQVLNSNPIDCDTLTQEIMSYSESFVKRHRKIGTRVDLAVIVSTQTKHIEQTYLILINFKRA